MFSRKSGFYTGSFLDTRAKNNRYSSEHLLFFCSFQIRTERVVCETNL